MKYTTAFFGAFVGVTTLSTNAFAMTQDEAIVAIRQQVGGGGGDSAGGAYAWMAFAALGLSVVLLVMRWRRGQRVKKPVMNDHAKLLRELRREAGISRATVRALRRAAADAERKRGVKVESPLVMALCPSLKGKRAA